MKKIHKTGWTILMTIIVGLLAGSANAQDDTARYELLIDDFTSGEVAIGLSGTDSSLRSQSGTMLGGWRQINYSIRAQNGMPDIPAGNMKVIPELGKVVVSHEYNTGHRSVYRYGKGYGQDAPGTDLNVDLSSYDQFEVDFEGADLNVTVHITLCTKSCDQRAQTSKNIVKKQVTTQAVKS